jgi:RNA polymerase sigma-70 factor (ECF subfamily)
VTGNELQRLLASDLDGTFEQLLLSYQGPLYAFVLRLSGCAQDAEEIVQDTFVAAYRALTSYPPERISSLALRPWLYRIALNTLRNARRRRRFQVVALDGHDAEDAEPQRPEAMAEAAESNEELASLLLALPERYRVAVVLRHVQELTYPEIAEAVGQPIGTVKSNVHRGIAMLRQLYPAREYEVQS